MSANECLILAIGPAFSDILIKLNDIQYNNIRNLLFSKDSTWVRLDERFELSSFVSTLGITNPMSYMEGGSTILGTLSALPINIRNKCKIITYEGMDNNDINQQSFNVYVKTVNDLGLSLDVRRTKGANMVGMVLVSENNNERLLITHSDKNIIFKGDNNSFPSADYLLVNGFELLQMRQNPIISLIESRQYKVVLGLGSKEIIEGNLKNKLIDYCRNGYVHCLAGNYQEIQELYKCDIYSLRKEPVFSKIPYILVTLGSAGMVGYSPKELYYQQSFHIDEKDILSTSGAGDIALGLFLTGIIKQEYLPEILHKAAYGSSKILRRLSNVFNKGIEHA